MLYTSMFEIRITMKGDSNYADYVTFFTPTEWQKFTEEEIAEIKTIIKVNKKVKNIYIGECFVYDNDLSNLIVSPTTKENYLIIFRNSFKGYNYAIN